MWKIDRLCCKLVFFVIVIHFQCLGPTHKLTMESAHFESAMFNSKGHRGSGIACKYGTRTKRFATSKRSSLLVEGVGVSMFCNLSKLFFVYIKIFKIWFNIGNVHSRHLCKIITILGCCRCLIFSSIEKMNSI
jgi:hypothetical protein